ncbi:MAG: hypothetical protein JRM73_04640 [Nitrososphaerota archaeon]|nr:hypothetical protein [Nitrososphaerota archaeon]
MKTDGSGMLDAYQRWPSLAKEGFRVNYSPRSPPKKAYILGMGGSAAAGDIIEGWLYGRKGLEIGVMKGGVPSAGMKDSIAVACSVSGNTVETVQMLSAAVEGGAQAVSISGDGMLSEKSAELGVPVIRVPKAMAQRLMLPFLVYSALSVLNSSFDLRCEDEVDESVRSMESEWSDASPARPEPGNGAKVLASALVHKVPAIYSDRIGYGVGVRFKNVLNENSKKHAHFDVVPEAFHNEIESWEDPGTDFLPVFIRHSWESPRDSAKVDHMVRILVELGKTPVQLRGKGASILSQLMSMTYRLDLASYYLAVALGRDPTPTSLLDRLKSAGGLPNSH